MRLKRGQENRHDPTHHTTQTSQDAYGSRPRKRPQPVALMLQGPCSTSSSLTFPEAPQEKQRHLHNEALSPDRLVLSGQHEAVVVAWQGLRQGSFPLQLSLLHLPKAFRNSLACKHQKTTVCPFIARLHLRLCLRLCLRLRPRPCPRPRVQRL